MSIKQNAIAITKTQRLFAKSEKTTDYVLDCFAMFAYFASEPGGSMVKDLMEKARGNQVSLHMSIINLGELFYMACKKLNRAKALSIVSDTKSLPINIVSVTDSQVWSAAELKANFNISYADAFAASLAQSLKASVVTGDPEFKEIQNSIKLFWILSDS